MTPEQFCYWLNGYFDLNQGGKRHSDLTIEQVKCIKDHLALVFQQIVSPASERVVKKPPAKDSGTQIRKRRYCGDFPIPDFPGEKKC